MFVPNVMCSQSTAVCMRSKGLLSPVRLKHFILVWCTFPGSAKKKLCQLMCYYYHIVHYANPTRRKIPNPITTVLRPFKMAWLSSLYSPDWLNLIALECIGCSIRWVHYLVSSPLIHSTWICIVAQLDRIELYISISTGQLHRIMRSHKMAHQSYSFCDWIVLIWHSRIWLIQHVA